MFKIIEDASVPRGTVRFEPCVYGQYPEYEKTIYRGHWIYVNPGDKHLMGLIDNTFSVLYIDERRDAWVMWLGEDGTLHLEAT